jgi:hypothetical protein
MTLDGQAEAVYAQLGAEGFVKPTVIGVLCQLGATVRMREELVAGLPGFGTWPEEVGGEIDGHLVEAPDEDEDEEPTADATTPA